MIRIERVLGELHRELMGFVTVNSAQQVVFAVAILLTGIMLFNILVYFQRNQERKSIEGGYGTHWSAHLNIRLLHLIVYLCVFRLAEHPLTLSLPQERCLHFIEGLIITVAAIGFLFSVVNLFDLFIQSSSLFAADQLIVGYVKKIKKLFNISAIIGGGAIFIYIQKEVFASWMLSSSWWQYLLTFSFIVLLWSFSVALNRLLVRIAAILHDSGEYLRLRLFLSSLLWPVRLLLFALIVYLAGNLIQFSDRIERFISQTITFLIIVASILLVYKLLDIIDNELNRYVEREDNLLSKNFAQMVRLFLRLTVLVIGAVYLIQKLSGQPVSALLAGLGIGALAVALAAQDTLKNLFGSIMIMADKPFDVGQRVVVDGYDGTIETIGFRSTRIRTLTGHEVTIPNEKMASNSIENIGRRPHIRRLTNLTITYDTPTEKVEKAVQIVRDLLENHEGMDPNFPPRVYFDEFNDCSLNIKMIYWYYPPDYWAFMDFGERTNLQIMRAFEAEGIEFAFPTTTTYLAQDEHRALEVGIIDKRLSHSGE